LYEFSLQRWWAVPSHLEAKREARAGWPIAICTHGGHLGVEKFDRSVEIASASPKATGQMN
jgi:hypothetical protein